MPEFSVWLNDEDEAEYARKWEADDPEDAATQAADFDHSNRDGHEWTWPVIYMVRELATARIFAVEIEREFDPHFFSEGCAAFDDFPPANHVKFGHRLFCRDVRLRNDPSKWPAGHTYMGLMDIENDEAALERVTCVKCAKRTKDHIDFRKELDDPRKAKEEKCVLPTTPNS